MSTNDFAKLAANQSLACQGSHYSVPPASTWRDPHDVGGVSLVTMPGWGECDGGGNGLADVALALDVHDQSKRVSGLTADTLAPDPDRVRAEARSQLGAARPRELAQPAVLRSVFEARYGSIPRISAGERPSAFFASRRTGPRLLASRSPPRRATSLCERLKPFQSRRRSARARRTSVVVSRPRRAGVTMRPSRVGRHRP